MEFVKYDTIGSSFWDQFCLDSDDACFYHTATNMDFTLYMHYTEENRQNLSFSVLDEKKMIAVVPLMKEVSYSDSNKHIFGFSGSYEPFPALINNISSKKRSKILKLIFSEIDRLASEHHINYASFAIPPLIPPMKNGSFRVNPLPAFGFTDTQVATHVVDLDQSEDKLLSQCRKGHKSDIKFAQKNGGNIKIFDYQSITEKEFNDYRNIHFQAAGRQTRPDKTWDIMHDWIKNKVSILVVYYSNDGKPIAGALHMIYKGRAFYGSAAVIPEYKKERGVMHSLLWETMKYLKKNNIKWFELGMQSTPTFSQEVASSKEINIALFKRGFGGINIPWYRGEKFYNYEFMEKILKDRMNQMKTWVV